MPTKTVTVQEAQEHLHELLSLVRDGTEIILTDAMMPLARLVPIQAPAPTGPQDSTLATRAEFDDPFAYELSLSDEDDLAT